MPPPRLRHFLSSASVRRHGFTLIELLVVIAIISILAGLLLPVVSKVMENAKKVETKTAALQIVDAVKNYQTEYGVYPVPAPAAGGVATDTDYDSNTGNAALFTVLQSLNTDYATTNLNFRRIKYYEGRDAKSATLPKSGFVPANATTPKGNKGAAVKPGDLLDSWGNRYLIRIDSGFTDAVYNPYVANGTNDSTTDNASQILRNGVIVWTYGSDGLIGNNGNKAILGDDVISWQ